ncbi:ABC transporter substrate-binding protein [Halobacillus ihumii]|uniref:ABC transporter substrate-binding protein n=1 Tax=Halobacillus ihumii TaxID=2686092 RepID=UPI0013D60229|nr:ABC transporter substrate-binding protein [Halobacillus ihumii]
MRYKIVGILIFLFVSTGCSSNINNGESATNINREVDYSNPEGTIVWSCGNIGGGGLRKELIDRFEEKYSDVNVVLQETPATTNGAQSYYTMTIGGQNPEPDVYCGDSNWPAQFGEAGLALDLSTIMPESFWERFPKKLVDAASYKGGIYGAPLYDNIGYLYYRKDLLKKANIPVPETWEELKRAASHLQEAGLVDYGFVWQGASYEGLTTNFLEYLHAAGGEVFNDQGEVHINTEETEKALSFMKSLISSNASPQAVTTFHEDESMSTFSAGSAAFLRNWSYAYRQAQNPSTSQISNKVGVTKIPSFENGKHNATRSGWNVFINPHTKNLEASLAFMDSLTSKKAQRLMLVKYGILPTNVEVQSNPQLIKEYELLDIYHDVVKTPRPKTPKYNALSEAIYVNTNELLSQNKRVKDVLKEMESRMKSVVRSES